MHQELQKLIERGRISGAALGSSCLEGKMCQCQIQALIYLTHRPYRLLHDMQGTMFADQNQLAKLDCMQAYLLQ